MRVLIPIILLAFVGQSLAEDVKPTKPANPEPEHKIYRVIGPNGEIILTDQPSPGAKEVEVPPPSSNVYTPPPLPAFTPSPQTTTPATHDEGETSVSNYTSFVITAPANEETIWANDGSVTLQASISPELSGNHVLKFVVDGKSYDANGMSVTLDNIDRGEHKVHAEIRDSNNAVLQSTPAITIFVHRPTVKN